VSHVDSPFSPLPAGAPLKQLPLIDVQAFFSNLRMYWVAGTTLWLHLPATDEVPHFGHWARLMAEVFGQLSSGQTARRPAGDKDMIDTDILTVIIPSIRRTSVMASPWIRDMLLIAITHQSPTRVGPPRVPRLVFWDDLEKLKLSEWLGFENVLVIPQTNIENASLSLDSGPHALPLHVTEQFRRAAHLKTGVPMVSSPKAVLPLVVTLLIAAEAHGGLANNGEILAALRDAAGRHAKVRPYSPTKSVPLESFLGVMSRTSVLVGRHGELLANAMFLPPGAAVIELAPMNCQLGLTAGSFTALTTGQTSSYAVWRAPSAHFMRYASTEDFRYHVWNAKECAASTDCQKAHGRAAVRGDVGALSEALRHAIGRVTAHIGM
jgi:hypothetical protein